MRPEFSDSLFIAAAISFGLCSLLTLRYLPKRQAILVSAIKVLIAFIYFGVFNEGQWTLRDDLTYLRNAEILVDRGYNPLSVLIEPVGLRSLAVLSSGWHIGYAWWNLVAISSFGANYFSAVFLNIALTCLAGWALCALIKDSGKDDSYAQRVAVFFLLQWEVLTWSSFLNVKDVPLLALSVISLFGLNRAFNSGFGSQKRLLGAAAALLAMFGFLWIRFYTPVLLGLATAGWLLMSHQRCDRRAGFGVLIFGVLIAIALNVQNYFGRLSFDPVLIVGGAVRFMLTPQPWSIDPGYKFLTLSSVLHLLFLVPAVLGAVILAKSNRAFQLGLIYLLILAAFYGFVDELQGPRHRLQIAFVFAWAQWQFVESFAGMAWRRSQAGEAAG